MPLPWRSALQTNAREEPIWRHHHQSLINQNSTKDAKMITKTVTGLFGRVRAMFSLIILLLLQGTVCPNNPRYPILAYWYHQSLGSHSSFLQRPRSKCDTSFFSFFLVTRLQYHDAYSSIINQSSINHQSVINQSSISHQSPLTPSHQFCNRAQIATRHRCGSVRRAKPVRRWEKKN